MFTCVLLAAALIGDGRPSELPHPVLIRLYLLKLAVNNINRTSSHIDTLKEIASRRPDLASECERLIASSEQHQRAFAANGNKQLDRLAADAKHEGMRLIKTYLPFAVR
jgi:hypothetical protein